MSYERRMLSGDEDYKGSKECLTIDDEEHKYLLTYRIITSKYSTLR